MPCVMTYVVWTIVIAIGVQNDGQSGEVILAAKDRPGLHALLCVPNGKSVAEQFSSLAVHLKANVHFPIASHHGLWIKH